MRTTSLGPPKHFGRAAQPGDDGIVNAKIKFRKPYRSFAVGSGGEAESAEKYVEKLGKHKTLQAITHVGTGRLQTVFHEQGPRYYHLTERFGQATGVPVMLNTSF